MRIRKGVILSSVLASVLILTVFSNAQVWGTSETVVRVVPPPFDVNESQNFTVYLDIYDVVDLMAFYFKISWDPEFVEYVSHAVYPPWPIPSPIIPQPIIGENYIEIAASSLGATFSGSATIASMTFHALKSGTTSITISEVQLAPDQPVIIEDATVTILPPPSNTWVTAAGTVSSYGPNPADGLTSIFAITDKWAEGWCVFTVPPLGPIILIYPPPPFNFTLYFVRIVNASAVKLDYNGRDLWVSGFLEVGNVTNPTSMRQIANLMQNTVVAPGELSITSNWTRFTIDIEGFESIQGNVSYYCTRKIGNSNESFPRCDLNRDCRIDMRDIGKCCSAFGSTLGFNGYEFYVDTNFDLQINMRDIGNCCDSFGKKY